MTDTAVSEDEAERIELITFSVSEAYVYAPIPSAGSYGHRAELWDVNTWLKVRVTNSHAG